MFLFFLLLSTSVLGQTITVGRQKGVTVIKGTKAQIEWAEKEMACFIHWNIELFTAFTAGCSCWSHWDLPDISMWNPTAVNTDEWITTGMAMVFSFIFIEISFFCTFNL